MSYTKLSASLLTSSLWGESADIRIVWITLLAMANKHGEVISTVPGLARLASVPIRAVEEALEKFLSPDPYSRTPDDEGRRIEVIEGGWALLNHAKYRIMASKEDQKSANAIRQARHREKKARNAQLSQKVTTSNAESEKVTHEGLHVTQDRDIADADADVSITKVTETEEGFVLSAEDQPEKANPKTSKAKGSESEVVEFALSFGLPESDGIYMFNLWESNGWMRGNSKIKDWRAAFRAWHSAHYLPSQKAVAVDPKKSKSFKDGWGDF